MSRVGQGQWIRPPAAASAAIALRGCRVFIASVVTTTTGFGSDDIPWRAIDPAGGDWDTDGFLPGASTTIVVPAGLGGRYIYTARFNLTCAGTPTSGYVINTIISGRDGLDTTEFAGFNTFVNAGGFRWNSSHVGAGILEDADEITMTTTNSLNTNVGTSGAWICLQRVGD